LGFDPSRFEEVRDLLAGLVSGGKDSCLNGTPMIPLHLDTVRDLLGYLDDLSERRAPKVICGYPLPGWRLQRVEYDDGRQLQAAPGWVVSLHAEGDPWVPRRYRCVMTRSLVGPLEAWAEAIKIAQLENETAAHSKRTET
jgi:hypothetical protein